VRARRLGGSIAAATRSLHLNWFVDSNRARGFRSREVHIEFG
jgi:hypothetical protein